MAELSNLSAPSSSNAVDSSGSLSHDEAPNHDGEAGAWTRSKARKYTMSEDPLRAEPAVAARLVLRSDPPPDARLRRYSPPHAHSYDFNSGRISPDTIPFRDDSPPLHAKHPIATETPNSIERDLFKNEYPYIGIGPEQVRLLLLSKGGYDEPVYCSLKTMHTIKLEGTQLVYQALSYAWGDGVTNNEIFLQDVDVQVEGRSPAEVVSLLTLQMLPRRFYVRSNLYHALKRLRSQTTDLWFWIDAICINQEDDAEKSHQLAKMQDIFCNAWNVCIWIGESDDANDKGQHAMDFIPLIVNLRLLDRMMAREGPDQKTAAHWVAFANLLRRPWFRRRWVIQEVSSSRRASVQCGSKSINWIDFADAVQLFMVKLERIRAIYNSSELSKQDPDALNHIESTGAKAIVTTTNNLLRKTERGTILDRLWNIESLVVTFLHFDVTDPRDTIYALLSLASDGHLSVHNSNGGSIRHSLVPNYTKSAHQIYKEFVQHCIFSSGSLDIICRHWALPVADGQGTFWQSLSSPSFHLPYLKGLPSLPTWMGRVTDSPFGPPSLFTDRLNGDSLVGQPGKRIYNASRGRAVDVHFYDPMADAVDQNKFVNAPFDGTLFAKGIILSRISRVSSRVVDGTISDDCLEIAGWNSHGDVNDIPDRLWRSPVADRTSDGENMPFWYRRACIYCLKKASPDGDLNTSKLIANQSLPETVIEYLKRVQAVVWNRRFLVCHEPDDDSNTLFGLGSRYVREGDLVCILFGCSVPVILRRQNVFGDLYFEFFGECYIHAKMDGEALAGMEEESLIKATTEFNIR